MDFWGEKRNNQKLALKRGQTEAEGRKEKQSEDNGVERKQCERRQEKMSAESIKA